MGLEHFKTAQVVYSQKQILLENELDNLNNFMVAYRKRLKLSFNFNDGYNVPSSSQYKKA
ncbi:CLUMA_CG012458, isoform A [Clunio marinus]|uniref:CLUMA_CG012458, isoform A n=1 Tax=Clunio marinus TaxID=568069 RepID=A0A1J1IFG7_9DIPT|nr:CLUMA_CG012458, isoform A [Clunio marinus]